MMSARTGKKRVTIKLINDKRILEMIASKPLY